MKSKVSRGQWLQQLPELRGRTMRWPHHMQDLKTEGLIRARASARWSCLLTRTEVTFI